MNIVWLSFAQRDLASISTYYKSTASTAIAHRIMREIVHSASVLSDNPYLGRPSESVDDIHELHVPQLPYLIPYRVIDDRIEILRVFHESQNHPSTWQET